MKIRIFCVAVSILTAHCSYAETAIRVDVIKPDHISLALKNVGTKLTSEGLYVGGNLVSNSSGVIPAGHIDIVLLDSRGVALAEKFVQYNPQQPPQLPRNSKSTLRNRGAAFHAVLAESLPAGSVIRVSYHRGDIAGTHFRL
jgi:hypothetical protein